MPWTRVNSRWSFITILVNIIRVPLIIKPSNKTCKTHNYTRTNKITTTSDVMKGRKRKRWDDKREWRFPFPGE